MKAVEAVQRAVKRNPQAMAIAISLDQSPEILTTYLKAHHLGWPAYCDGKGWNSPLARGFGINSLPTVWLVDESGILRRLNVRGDWDEAIRKARR
jgi:hypothetical protein